MVKMLWRRVIRSRAVALWRTVGAWKQHVNVVLRRGLWEVGQLVFDVWRILQQGQARTQHSRDRREPVTKRGRREVREESKVHPGGALQTFGKMHSFVLDMMGRHWQPWAGEWLTAYPPSYLGTESGLYKKGSGVCFPFTCQDVVFLALPCASHTWDCIAVAALAPASRWICRVDDNCSRRQIGEHGVGVLLFSFLPTAKVWQSL